MEIVKRYYKEQRLSSLKEGDIFDFMGDVYLFCNPVYNYRGASDSIECSIECFNFTKGQMCIKCSDIYVTPLPNVKLVIDK